jgi:conjugal transfer mating pair stabilization protein TraG
MALITGVYAIFTAYFSPGSNSLLKHFLLPILALVVLCFSVTTTVVIEDRLPMMQGGINLISREAFNLGHRGGQNNINPSSRIEGVPFVIGFISQAISTLGYKMTVNVENFFHTVDDKNYSQTGMIFGAETALDMNEIVIKDGNLDNNLRTFCKTCMLYDLALNLYTIKDLKNETNLLSFLENNTGVSRYMNYVEDMKEGVGSPESSKLVSCKEAMEKISEKFAGELEIQQKKQIFMRLPIAYQALTNIKGNDEDMIKQMLVMSVITEEMSSEAFAVKRAALQQKSTWKTMGGIADGLVVATRCVIEALIYGAVIFVIPLLFLPSGFNYLKTWVWLLVWIQLWPPFYAILDYISLIAAKGQADGLFDASKANTCCLTIYNTVGLSEVFGNVSAYAKSMKILIPPLSYAILQGGVGSFVHLTSSMMGASQQAVSQASSDEVSGNYSFGNTSMDSTNYANATYGQQNYASSLRSGFISSDSGDGKIDFSPDTSVVQEKVSSLSHGISLEESHRQSLATSLTDSKTAHESSTKSLNESISNTGRDAMDLTSYIAHDMSYSTSDATSESREASKSAQSVESMVNTFAKDHNLSTHASWEIFGSIGAGIPLTEISGGLSNRYGVNFTNTWSDALSLSESSEYREAFNEMINFSQNFSRNSTDGEGERLATSFTQSIDHLRSNSEQYSATLDTMNQFSKASSNFDDRSVSEKHNLTQEFMDYCIDERGHSINEFPTAIFENDPKHYKELVSDFTKRYYSKMVAPEGYVEPERFHSNAIDKINNMSAMNTSLDTQPFENRNVGGYTKQEVAQKLSVRQVHDSIIEETREQIKESREHMKQTRNSFKLHPMLGRIPE